MRKAMATAKNLFWDKKYPVSLIQFVTNRCNARCSFCFIDFDNVDTQKKSSEMSVEEFDRLTRNLGPLLMHVNITGGEPFLRTDLTDIIKCYFRNATLTSLLINTNGSTPQRIGALIDSVLLEYPEKRLYFVFSLDSFAERHDRIRKIRGLFDKVMESYKIVNSYGKRTSATFNLTVSEENYKDICGVYETLKKDYGVKNFSPVITRDEGVYKTPAELRMDILEAYEKLSAKMVEDTRSGATAGFARNSFRDVVINAKSRIQYRKIADNYKNRQYRSLCPAGSIFGVVYADGTVYPCEILDKPLGNLKEYDFDFMKLWHDKKALETKNWIKETKCNCHWECAWTYNILSNPKYYLPLAKNILGLSRGGGT